jgi:hypothetical protein
MICPFCELVDREIVAANDLAIATAIRLKFAIVEIAGADLVDLAERGHAERDDRISVGG